MQSQRLEAIGQLTGGLAHDFNNLIGVIVGNLDLIEWEMPSPDESIAKRINVARRAALRGSDITRSLLAVARRQSLEISALDLNKLVTSFLPLARSAVSPGVTVVVEPAGQNEEIIVNVDASGLNNALLNLAINARDAMESTPGSSRLFVRVRSELLLSPSEKNLTPGWYAIVEVEDTGAGMSTAVKERAFEAFFSTKPQGKGTGLGLSIVRGLTEQLGGTTTISSTVGVGTTVSIYLPLEENCELSHSRDARAE